MTLLVVVVGKGPLREVLAQRNEIGVGGIVVYTHARAGVNKMMRERSRAR